MSTQSLQAPLDPALIHPASRYISETREALLACDIEELAVLRFSIILTARWESSGCEAPDRRQELRNELAILRKHYGDKIDEIAMTFGITAGMNAKEEVERTVMVPRDAKLTPMMSNCEEEVADSDFEV